MILLSLLTAFAWAIGGEKYFGRWKRGVLVALGFVLAGAGSGLPWWYYAVVLALAYSYQALFYDKCIKLIWRDQYQAPTTVLQKVWGWLGLGINGTICASMPLAYALASGGSPMRITLSVLIPAVGFPLAAWLSNELKWGWNGCTRINGVGIWCPKDTWWWACWIYGLLLGACVLW